MESQSPSSSCKQCTENQSNLYITCDCARNLPPTHGPLTSEGCKGVGEKGAKIDSVKSQSTESKPYRTAKTVIYDIVRIYESTPPRTMKYLALISSLILFFAVLSLVLAQRDEAAQSKYGMAFPIDESSSSSSSLNKPDARVAASLTIAATVAGIPGESGFPSAEESSRETSTVLPSTTISSVGEENSTKPTDSDDDSGKAGSSDLSSSSLSGSDDEEKGDTGDRNPRIVFIERLMGLHLSAPLRSASGSEGNPLFSALTNSDSDKDSSESSGSSSSSISPSGNGSSTATSPNGNEKDKETKNSLDKVNAKWATRMRKFTIPISSASGLSNSDSDSSDPINPLSEVGPNPMLRYAAAAMMSRLIAAAARAQMEAQAREAMTNTLIVRAEGKDKDEESDDETVPVIVATMRDERLAGPGRLPLPPPPPMYGRPMHTGRVSSLIRPHMGPQPSNSLPSFVAHHGHHHVHQHPARSLSGDLPAMSQRNFISAPPQGPPSASQIVSSSHRGPLGPVIIQRRAGNDRNSSPSTSVGGNNPNVQPVLVMLAVPVNSAENGRSPINEPTSSSSSYPGYHSSPYVRSHVGPFYPTVPYSVPYVRPSYSPAPQAAYAVPVHVPVPVSYGPAPAPPSNAAYYPAQRPIYHYPVQRSMAAAYSHPRPVIEVPVDVPYHVPVQVPVTMRSMAAHPHHIVSHPPPPPPPPHPHHGSGFAYPHQPALVHPMSHSDQDPSGSDQDHIVLLYDAEIHHGEGGPGGPAGDDMDNSASDGPKSGGPTFIISRPPTGPSSPSSSPPSMVTPNKMKLWREIIAAKQAAATASSSQQQGVRFIPITVASSEDQSPSSSQSSSSQSAPSASASSISSVHHQPSPSYSYPHHFIAQPNGPREQTSETIPQPAFLVLADQEEH